MALKILDLVQVNIGDLPEYYSDCPPVDAVEQGDREPGTPVDSTQSAHSPVMWRVK